MVNPAKLTKNGLCAEVNDHDLSYLLAMIRRDLTYLRSRSAARKGGRGDANAVKIKKREELAGKLLALLRKV